TERGEFESELLGEAADRMFAGHVGSQTRCRCLESGGGDDVDDDPAVVSRKVSRSGSCAVEGAVDIDGVDLPPLIVGGVENAECWEHAGIAHPDLKATEFTCRILRRMIHGGGVGDVDLRGDHASAVSCRQFGGGLCRERLLEV